MPQFSGFNIKSMKVLSGETYDAYAYHNPPCFPDRAWMGGWNQQADIGPDILYSSPAGTVALTPLAWANPAVSAAYHLNDPTVIHPKNTNGQDRSGWTFMYFTQLPNTSATADRMLLDNQVGWAVSIDGAKSWINLGTLIADGWAPHAIHSPDGTTIDLYYHTGGTVVPWMVRLDYNGWQQVAPPRQLVDTNGAPIGSICNAVCQQGGQLFLVGNAYSFGTPFGDIVAYTADIADPYTWKPLLTGGPVLVNSTNYELITPELRPLGGNSFALTFTENEGCNYWGYSNGERQRTNTMEWVIELTP